MVQSNDSKGKDYPVISATLATITLLTSLSVSYFVNGALFSTVRIIDLAKWGGVRPTDVGIVDFWRIFSAQLVHVKWPHMLYNVVCLFATAALVERHLGRLSTFFTWALIGGVATLISPIFVEPPYNIGTGASQAVFAFVGCLTALIALGRMQGLWPKALIAIALVPALGLDLVFAGHPKIGHVTALIGGFVFGVIQIKLTNRPS